MNITSTQRFLTELERIASKFEWFYDRKEYPESGLYFSKITAYRNKDDLREYIPLTAVVDEVVGKYYEPNFFDKAAGEVFMSPQLAMQIIDVCDEWPDRLHGYKPKGYEVKFRNDITKILFGE